MDPPLQDINHFLDVWVTNTNDLLAFLDLSHSLQNPTAPSPTLKPLLDRLERALAKVGEACLIVSKILQEMFQPGWSSYSKVYHASQAPLNGWISFNPIEDMLPSPSRKLHQLKQQQSCQVSTANSTSRAMENLQKGLDHTRTRYERTKVVDSTW